MSIEIASNFRIFAQLPIDYRFTFADIASRDALDAGERYEGLKVYVLADQTNYQLQGGTDNADWVAIGGGGITTTAEYYVDPAGNDANPGTAASPFATVQKGLTEAAASIADEVTVYLADGNYAEILSVPLTGSGIINIVGNIGIPASVILSSPVAGVGTVLTQSNPYITLTVNGLNIIDGQFGTRVFAGNYVSLGVGYSNCAVPLYGTGPQAHVNFIENTTGDGSLSSSGGAGSYGLVIDNGASIIIDQNLTVLGAEQCIVLRDCKYYLADAKTLTLTPIVSTAARGIVFDYGSDGVFNSGITTDGTAGVGLITTGYNAGVEYNQCSQRISHASSINPSNYFSGITHKGVVTLTDDTESGAGNTYTFTGCTVNVIHDQNVNFDILNQYDTTSILYVGKPNTVSGRAYLERYISQIEG